MSGSQKLFLTWGSVSLPQRYVLHECQHLPFCYGVFVSENLIVRKWERLSRRNVRSTVSAGHGVSEQMQTAEWSWRGCSALQWWGEEWGCRHISRGAKDITYAADVKSRAAGARGWEQSSRTEEVVVQGWLREYSDLSASHCFSSHQLWDWNEILTLPRPSFLICKMEVVMPTSCEIFGLHSLPLCTPYNGQVI